MELFLDTMKPDKDTRILDVGGYSWHWRGSGVESRITLLNLRTLEKDSLAGNEQFEFVEGDATDMPFDDDSFDLVYSNSVIEHLFNYGNQTAFAEETRRVGKRYWIQTPAKEFPVEPHLLTPFIHWLPKKASLPLTKWFTVRAYLRDRAFPTRQHVYEHAKELNLLTEKQFAALYPDCELFTERCAGFKKSYVAYKTWDSSHR